MLILQGVSQTNALRLVIRKESAFLMILTLILKEKVKDMKVGGKQYSDFYTYILMSLQETVKSDEETQLNINTAEPLEMDDSY